MIAILKKLRLRKPIVADKSQASDEEEQRYRPLEWWLIKRMLRELAPLKWMYIVAYTIGAVHLFLEMQGPKFIRRIADHVSGSTHTQGPARTAAYWTLGWIILAWAGVFVVSVICQRLLIIYAVRAGETAQFGMREKMFNHLQTLSMSYYDKTKLGRIISRMTSDIGSLREVNVWGIWHCLSVTMQIVFAATMMCRADWRIFLSVLPIGVALFFVNRYFVKKMGRLWQEQREGFTKVSTNLAENITGVRVVAAFNRQDPNLETFNDLQIANTRNNLAVSRMSGVFHPSLSLLGFCGRAIILIFGGYLVATSGREEMTIGKLMEVYLYWDWFMNPIIFLGGFYNQLLQAMAGAERVFSLLDLKPEVQDVSGAKPLPRIVGHVKFENVTFGYTPDRPVLHEISFEAFPGQMVALVGATGSGKSSIISLIARFYQPQQGRVLVDGNDIRHMTGDSLHKQMGLVLQSNYLFTGTVIDNIRYARTSATDEQVVEAARLLGTHDAIMSLQDGYQTQVGERGASMSLGQRQLICFTRAFLADPRIFMLDEATSAIDTATELVVQRSLEKLLAGRTTFVVAHRLSTIMRADMILVIDAGRIIERGTHRQLVDLGGKYAHLYEQFVMAHE